MRKEKAGFWDEFVKEPFKAQLEWHMLAATLRYHEHLYYEHARPEITDSEYDRLYIRLQALEAEFPRLVNSLSPTQRVGH